MRKSRDLEHDPPDLLQQTSDSHTCLTERPPTRAAVAVFQGEAMQQQPAETDERDEHARVDAWRLQQLLEAGYHHHRAEQLASRHDIDVHQAIALLKAGCPQRTALQILL